MILYETIFNTYRAFIVKDQFGQINRNRKKKSTFGVIKRVHVSADVTFQIGMKAGRWGKESKADGHQVPASLQAVIAEILCSLTTQLNIKLITQALITPPTHHDLTKTEN